MAAVSSSIPKTCEDTFTTLSIDAARPFHPSPTAHAHVYVSVDRPQRPLVGSGDAAFLSAPAHGLCGLWNFRPHRHRRDVLRQRLSRPLRLISSRARVLGRHPLGVKN